MVTIRALLRVKSRHQAQCTHTLLRLSGSFSCPHKPSTIQTKAPHSASFSPSQKFVWLALTAAVFSCDVGHTHVSQHLKATLTHRTWVETSGRERCLSRCCFVNVCLRQKGRKKYSAQIACFTRSGRLSGDCSKILILVKSYEIRHSRDVQTHYDYDASLQILKRKSHIQSIVLMGLVL